MLNKKYTANRKSDRYQKLNILFEKLLLSSSCCRICYLSVPRQKGDKFELHSCFLLSSKPNRWKISKRTRSHHGSGNSLLRHRYLGPAGDSWIVDVRNTVHKGVAHHSFTDQLRSFFQFLYIPIHI